MIAIPEPKKVGCPGGDDCMLQREFSSHTKSFLQLVASRNN